MKNLKGRHITIIGAARSGLAAARLLQSRGAEVFVSDHSRLKEAARESLRRSQIQFEEMKHSTRAKEADLVIVSPGVPDQVPIMQHYREAGTPVYSELEVASWYNKSPVIAVTGSNGKTTVTRWLAHVWETAGRPCLLAGNIGRAFSDVVDQTGPETTVILEVSSFQLDYIDRFCPEVGLLLNITPDHLDRYENRFDLYADAKMRISENQRPEHLLLYNADDPKIADQVETLRKRGDGPRLLSWSSRKELAEGAFIRNNELIVNINQTEEVIMTTDEIGLPGTHNLNNGLATALAARVSEIKNETIRESLQSFEGVEHRLEPVAEIEGVRYINDSKATNINAAWFALDSFNVPMVLILGGRDKGNNWLALADQLREKAHTVVAIGEARPAILEQLDGVVPNLLEAESMKDAVRMAAGVARRGEIVLLSPACASFDMFDDYEQRGDEFKKSVLEL